MKFHVNGLLFEPLNLFHGLLSSLNVKDNHLEISCN